MKQPGNGVSLYLSKQSGAFRWRKNEGKCFGIITFRNFSFIGFSLLNYDTSGWTTKHKPGQHLILRRLPIQVCTDRSSNPHLRHQIFNDNHVT